MSGAFGKCSPTRWLRLPGLNPSDEDDHVADQFLNLLRPNDREGDLAKSLEAPSPVSGAVPDRRLCIIINTFERCRSRSKKALSVTGQPLSQLLSIKETLLATDQWIKMATK